MKLVTIVTSDQTRTIELAAPTLASDLLLRHHHPLDMPCAGRGSCGKCKAVITGELSPPSKQEQALISEEERALGVRLACMTTICGTALIKPFDPHVLSRIISHGYMPEFVKDPWGGRLGMAVDIGTTTVAAYLYRLSDCTLLSSAVCKNPQISFGADVISRIERSMDSDRAALAEGILSCIQLLAADLCKNANQPTPRCSDIDSMVITGNTTMLYLLTQTDPTCLSASPFIPTTVFGDYIKLPLPSLPNANIYLPGCISAYVGADITCAILSSGQLDNPKPTLLVDIGTNGEMSICSGGALLCCSTAAGPALEGAGIYHGMTATSGAINAVQVTDGKLSYTTIDNKPPRGICGSGIIDAAAALLTLGILDETGIILEEDHDYAFQITEINNQPAFRFENSNVVITQQDIRSIQLAKSAICAGMRTLLKTAGLTPDDIDTLYIAGGFGSFINTQSAAVIGLIPQVLAAKTTVIGNAAGMGAAMLLQSSNLIAASKDIAASARTVELSTDPYFMDCYIDGMLFGAV